MITLLLVEDEGLARAKLRRILQREADVQIVGEARTGREAIERIGALKPDAVFLDIDLPDMTGFDVLRGLAPGPWPMIVFATAYDEYAVKAFEARALDYVLKPFDADRLRETLARVRERGRKADDTAGLRAAIDELSARQAALERSLAGVAAGHPGRLVVRVGAEFRLLTLAEVDWVRSADNYVELHVGGHRHLVRMTMSTMERKLDPARFARIHRATIVNLERIRALRTTVSGDLEIELADKTRLAVSRAYRARFLERATGDSK